MTSIVVVDDHPIFRRGLVSLFEANGYDVVGEAAGAAEAIALVDNERPDILLLDLGLPDDSGVRVAERVSGLVPATRIVVITMFDDDGSVRDALRAGACGYVVKDASPAQLLAAVRAAEAGATVLGPGIERPDDPIAAPLTSLGLTPRERSVLDLVARGLTNRQIAERLGLSGKTVSNNVSVILGKLGVADRGEAARTLRDVTRGG
ncbi:response regulator [Microbacterium sp.]|uniref:response regulator n=1 Tax=Microbacterium sp. TaxID=51671 RepID=UPI003C728577